MHKLLDPVLSCCIMALDSPLDGCRLCRRAFSIRNYKLTYHDAHHVCSDCFDEYDDMVNSVCPVCHSDGHADPMEPVYTAAGTTADGLTIEDQYVVIRQVASHVMDKYDRRGRPSVPDPSTMLNEFTRLFADPLTLLPKRPSVLLMDGTHLVPNMPLLEIIFHRCFVGTVYQNDAQYFLFVLGQLSDEMDESPFGPLL